PPLAECRKHPEGPLRTIHTLGWRSTTVRRLAAAFPSGRGDPLLETRYRRRNPLVVSKSPRTRRAFCRSMPTEVRSGLDARDCVQNLGGKHSRALARTRWSSWASLVAVSLPDFA